MTKGNSSENGVLKETYTENGEASTEFIATSIYFETEDDYYIDNSVLELGNNLVRPDSTDKYTISRSATLIGVYNINKGYADFKEIQILSQNDAVSYTHLDVYKRQPEMLEMIKQDIAKVISKYMKIDTNNMEIQISKSTARGRGKNPCLLYTSGFSSCRSWREKII